MEDQTLFQTGEKPDFVEKKYEKVGIPKVPKISLLVFLNIPKITAI